MTTVVRFFVCVPFFVFLVQSNKYTTAVADSKWNGPETETYPCQDGGFECLNESGRQSPFAESLPSLYLPILVVVDYEIWKSLLRNDLVTEKFVLSLWEEPRQYYKEYLNVNLFISGVRIVKNESELEVIDDPFTAAAQFFGYTEKLNKSDYCYEAAYYLRASMLARVAGVVGNSYDKRLCTDGRTGIIGVPVHSDREAVAYTIIHETGHHFGLEHDYINGTCFCDGKDRCMMFNSTLEDSTLKLSNCSYNQYRKNIRDNKLACLERKQCQTNLYNDWTLNSMTFDPLKEYFTGRIHKHATVKPIYPQLNPITNPYDVNTLRVQRQYYLPILVVVDYRIYANMGFDIGVSLEYVRSLYRWPIEYFRKHLNLNFEVSAVYIVKNESHFKIPTDGNPEKFNAKLLKSNDCYRLVNILSFKKFVFNGGLEECGYATEGNICDIRKRTSLSALPNEGKKSIQHTIIKYNLLTMGVLYDGPDCKCGGLPNTCMMSSPKRDPKLLLSDCSLRQYKQLADSGLLSCLEKPQCKAMTSPKLSSVRTNTQSKLTSATQSMQTISTTSTTPIRTLPTVRNSPELTRRTQTTTQISTTISSSISRSTVTRIDLKKPITSPSATNSESDSDSAFSIALFIFVLGVALGIIATILFAFGKKHSEDKQVDSGLEKKHSKIEQVTQLVSNELPKRGKESPMGHANV